MSSLNGKVAVVIGAGRGLGRSLAQRFAAENAKLVLAARTETDLNDVAAEVRQRGSEVVIVPADATREGDVARIRSEAVNRFSDPDVVISCVGGSLLKDLPDITVEDWNRVIDSNLTSVFLTMREFLPPMMERGSGQIIILSSRVGLYGATKASAYGAAKAGAIAFCRTWAKEAKQRGVNVLAIAPGPMDTPMRWEATPDFARERTANPDTIADFIAWLASHPEISFEDYVIPESINL